MGILDRVLRTGEGKRLRALQGLVPEIVPRTRRTVAEVIVAVSGSEEVLKETTALIWLSAAVSPTWQLTATFGISPDTIFCSKR